MEYGHGTTQRRSFGSALVALVIIVVLVCVVFGVKLYLKKKPLPDPDLTTNLAPWTEWEIRERSLKPRVPVSAQQPKITAPLEYSMNVHLAGKTDPRGNLDLFIGPGGGVGGQWYGWYYKTRQINCDIMGGTFLGQTFAGKVCRNKSGEEDPTKLYLLAKGTFMFQETNSELSRVTHRTGDLYVRGWLGPNHAIRGQIIITSDQKYSETFEWKLDKPTSE